MNCTNCLYLKSVLFILVFVLNALMTISAQSNKSDSIIFSIEDETVYKSEFLNQYQKNNNSGYEVDSISLLDYAELYLRFKLKVKAAKDKGFDTLPEFIKEYQSYRKQLADKFISNGKVTEDMVVETYHKMTNEVNASHILLKVEEGATPEDTLETYNKAIDLLKKIDAGESFEELAVKYSEDNSVRINNGNLGWFKAYKMVYPFETAAYKMNVGEVSQPVRTQFGYHIIKKNDERPSKGKIIVAHIMKNLKSKDSTYNAEQEIHQIYQKVLNGEDFNNLAKQFSDHKATASNGGEITPFSIGQLNSQKFTDVAFSLDKNNSVSKPFKTQFGWHIIKYLDNIPVKPLEEIKQDIIRKIKTTDRSQRLIKNIKEDLLKEYDVSINYEVLSLLEDRIDESIYKFKWSYEQKEEDSSKWILKIDNIEFSLGEFMKYIQSQQRSLNEKTISAKLNTAIDKFSYAKLIQIHNDNLENKSPQFAAEIKTYYEGLLLFKVMDEMIWKPQQNDSIAIQDYYDNNRNDFMSPTKIDGILASSKKVKNAEEIKDKIKEESLESLKLQYPDVIFKTLNEIDIEDPGLPKFIILEEDFTKIYSHNGQHVCIYITKVIPSEVKKLENVKGNIINILQRQKEDEWIDQLKNKYNIYMNRTLIQNLNRDLEN